MQKVSYLFSTFVNEYIYIGIRYLFCEIIWYYVVDIQIIMHIKNKNKNIWAFFH